MTTVLFLLLTLAVGFGAGYRRYRQIQRGRRFGSPTYSGNSLYSDGGGGSCGSDGGGGGGDC